MVLCFGSSSDSTIRYLLILNRVFAHVATIPNAHHQAADAAFPKDTSRIRGHQTICSKLHANRLGSSVPPFGGGSVEGLEQEIR